MLRRSNTVHLSRDADPRIDPIVRLVESLRVGVEALKDPTIEAKVRDYFERHPNYSCDMIHVAAVACGFQAAKQRAATLAQSSQTAKAISPRI